MHYKIAEKDLSGDEIEIRAFIIDSEANNVAPTKNFGERGITQA
ncbi:MAG: hypothetical protein AB8B57_06610 [Congregibacter sp.]